MKLVIFRKIFLLLIISSITGYTWAGGVDAQEFDTPEQEEIYTSLVSQLRCMVCQNQTIGDSNAALAKDLRKQVLELIQKGKSEQEIKTYMLDRYGDYVLYNPPFKLKTGLLWIGPFAFLLVGLVVVFLYTQRRKKQEPAELDVTDKEKIRKLLKNGDKL